MFSKNICLLLFLTGMHYVHSMDRASEAENMAALNAAMMRNLVAKVFESNGSAARRLSLLLLRGEKIPRGISSKALIDGFRQAGFSALGALVQEGVTHADRMAHNYSELAQQIRVVAALERSEPLLPSVADGMAFWGQR